MEDIYQWLVDMMAISDLWITGNTSPNPSHSRDGQKGVIFLPLELMTGICLATEGTEHQATSLWLDPVWLLVSSRGIF